MLLRLRDAVSEFEIVYGCEAYWLAPRLMLRCGLCCEMNVKGAAESVFIDLTIEDTESDGLLTSAECKWLRLSTWLSSALIGVHCVLNALDLLAIIAGDDIC